MNSTKHLVILAPPKTSILDLAGPLEVFSKANDYLCQFAGKSGNAYSLHLIATEPATIVETASGVPIVCEGDTSTVNYEVDTVLVSGIPNTPDNMVNEETLTWLRNHSGIRRMGSICAGAFILAEAGLLNHKRATTHWRVCNKLAKCYPQVNVEVDPIFVKDGNIYTSAGISTGMDLSLAMVEEDFGREIALGVARQLVLYLKRPGNQSQFSVILSQQEVDYQPINELLEWVIDHLNEKLTVEVLAKKVNMSPRNFARIFMQKTGITPAKYVEKIRVEVARRRLEETNLSLDEISTELGLGNADTLRRLFLRHLKSNPSEYRKNFTTSLV